MTSDALRRRCSRSSPASFEMSVDDVAQMVRPGIVAIVPSNARHSVGAGVGKVPAICTTSSAFNEQAFSDAQARMTGAADCRNAHR